MNTQTLHQAVHHAVLHDWDPIGVKNIPEAKNEYDAYVPKLCELLKSRKRQNDIVVYLWWLETEQIGLSGNRQATEEFAGRLTQIADTIEKGEKEK